MGVKILDGFKIFHIRTKESVWSWEISVPSGESKKKSGIK